MNEAEKLLEKLNNVPAEEPDEWEKEAIREFEEQKAAGTLELISLEELKDRAARANGRISLRIPKTLHSQLKAEAKMQGVSLNQYISYLLASRAH